MRAYDFILGDAGIGKSGYIYSYLTGEAEAHPDKRFYLFVPEQNTLKVQREIVEHSACHGMLNLDVLSFRLLFYRVIEELGIEGVNVLDDINKSLLIRKAALDLDSEGKLKLYHGKLRSRGFIDELKSFIAELSTYHIKPQSLTCCIEELADSELKNKLSEILAIYLRFKELSGQDNITSEETLSFLLKYMPDSHILDGSEIILDGFTGFVPAEEEILKAILLKAERVRFSFTLPEGEDPFGYDLKDTADIWWLSKKSIARVIDLASEAGVRISDKPCMMIRRDVPERDIYIHEFQDPQEEVRSAAERIRFEAHSGRIRYKSTALVVSDMDSYGELIKREFRSRGIPFFLDREGEAIESKAVELIRAAFNAIGSGYRYKELMAYLKNPLIGAKDTVDELDNLLRKRGTRGKNMLLSLMAEGGYSELDPAVRALISLEESLNRAHTIGAMSEALIAFTDEIELSLKSAAFSGLLSEQGLANEAGAEKRYLDLIFSLIGRTIDILGAEESDAKEYMRLMDAALSGLKGGLIPETMDTVVVGDMRRSRIEDIDTLYIIGANEGLLPGQGPAGGILSEWERETLIAVGAGLSGGLSFEMAPDARTDGFIEYFYLYTLMHKPNKELIISYPRSGLDGAKLLPSRILSKIKESKAEIKKDEREIISADLALTKLAKILSERHESPDLGRAALLYGALSEIPEYRKRADMVMRARFSARPRPKLSGEAAAKLYQDMSEMSVTRLEAFASCPFSQFLRYGLKLKEREEADVEYVDLGNIYHEALNDAWSKIKDKARDISFAETDLIADQAVESALSNYRDNVMRLSARNIFLSGRLKKTMRKTLRVLCGQIKSGSFRTQGTEIDFRRYIDRFRLKGRIDRVDIARDPATGKSFINVIDYKSGNKYFDALLVESGIDMQLVFYMYNALNGETHPGGMYYYHIDDPVIDYKDTVLRDAESVSAENLRLRGVASAEPGYMELIQREEGKVLSPQPDTLRLNEEEIFKLIDTTKANIEKFAGGILAGDIDIKPYSYRDPKKRREITACDYCSYKAVCGFKHHGRAGDYRKISS